MIPSYLWSLRRSIFIQSLLWLIIGWLAMGPAGAEPASQEPSAPSPTAAATAPTEPSSPAATASAETPMAAEPPDAVQQLIAQEQSLRQFLAGELNESVEPSSLFDIDITDPDAVSLEGRRLRAMQAGASEVSPAAGTASASPPDPGPPRAIASPSASPSSPAPMAPPDISVETELWQARVKVDAARLDFYQLPVGERNALTEGHAQRQQAAAQAAAANALAAVDEDALRAERQKQQALEAARLAHTEAERAVHEELARLLDVNKHQAEFEKELLETAGAISARQDDVLGHRRRISELLQRQSARDSSPEPVDAAYLDLHEHLEQARTHLSKAISEMASPDSRVPVAGPDALRDLPVEFDRSAVDKERVVVQARSQKLKEEERHLKEERARTLMNEVELLNRDRLQLVPHLSAPRRDEIRAFSLVGWEQARSEARQVWLTLQYHLNATEAWLDALQGGKGREKSAWVGVLLVFTLLLPVLALTVWRRKAGPLLARWDSMLVQSHAKSRGESALPMLSLRALRFFTRIRRPLEWLILIWAVVALLPDATRGLLEVELPLTIARWTLWGSLIVSAIDALSTDGPQRRRRGQSLIATGDLRLKSLRLVGRTVVVFGLILALSDELVGRGTTYSWVFSTCWFAAVPILLVLVSWWKHIIFARMDQIRKKNGFERWVLERQSGATSFLAAIAGGIYLFGAGTGRTLRGWLVTFTLVRRILAYLFRRGMSKQAAEAGATRTQALNTSVFEQLGPETPSEEIVPSVADAQVTKVIENIKLRGGGVYALVGERGSGKTTLMQRIARTVDNVARVQCPTGGLASFQEALTRDLGFDAETTLESAAGILDAQVGDSALLVDDAHLLIQPRMEGLRDFDRMLDLARNHSRHCTWIFAVDRTLWRFLERARGSKPLFDDVIPLDSWSEQAIVHLLQCRNQAVQINPSFKGLLGKLPEDADEIDIAEAIERTETAYYRLLWDYASGNPGVALHFWRNSLGVGVDERVCVRPFEAPDPGALEGLPDTAAFVLRAAVQLGWASEPQIAACTGLRPTQVRDVLRYGTVKGYFESDGENYHVTWDWFRAITRFLTRRHLLYSK